MSYIKISSSNSPKVRPAGYHSPGISNHIKLSDEETGRFQTSRNRLRVSPFIHTPQIGKRLGLNDKNIAEAALALLSERKELAEETMDTAEENRDDQDGRLPIYGRRQLDIVIEFKALKTRLGI